MKNAFSQLVLFSTKINKTHIQFVLMLVSLALLVLGAGAPEDVGGATR